MIDRAFHIWRHQKIYHDGRCQMGLSTKDYFLGSLKDLKYKSEKVSVVRQLKHLEFLLIVLLNTKIMYLARVFLHPSTFLTGSYKMPSSPLHASLHIFISMLIGAIIQPTFFCYKLQEINTQTNQRQKWDEAQGSHGCNVHTATSSEVDTREITNRFLFNRGKQCSMWLPKMHVIMS